MNALHRDGTDGIVDVIELRKKKEREKQKKTKRNTSSAVKLPEYHGPFSLFYSSITQEVDSEIN